MSDFRSIRCLPDDPGAANGASIPGRIDPTQKIRCSAPWTDWLRGSFLQAARFAHRGSRPRAKCPFLRVLSANIVPPVCDETQYFEYRSNPTRREERPVGLTVHPMDGEFVSE